MLRGFVYQGVLSEKEELVMFNDITEMALKYATNDAVINDDQFCDILTDNLGLNTIKPIAKLAWNTVYNFDADTKSKGLKHVNSIYRIQSDYLILSAEQMMFLDLEITTEIVVDLLKIKVESEEAYKYIKSYRAVMIDQIQELKRILYKKYGLK